MNMKNCTDAIKEKQRRYVSPKCPPKTSAAIQDDLLDSVAIELNEQNSPQLLGSIKSKSEVTGLSPMSPPQKINPVKFGQTMAKFPNMLKKTPEKKLMTAYSPQMTMSLKY